jgi:ATP-dependent Clp protease, protease subunit
MPYVWDIQNKKAVEVRGEKWFDIKNIDGGESVDIYIYGYIVNDKWDETDTGLTPLDFKEELDNHKDAKEINLFINSGGGSVFAGLSIYNMLKRHPAKKNAYIDGLAASISSVIPMAADRVYAPKTAMTLIHRASILAILSGNSNDFLKIAADLEAADDVIANVYMARTGKTKEDVLAIMSEDKLMSAEAAFDLGLVDELIEEVPRKREIKNEMPLTASASTSAGAVDARASIMRMCEAQVLVNNNKLNGRGSL